jgi:hypothetical protein
MVITFSIRLLALVLMVVCSPTAVVGQSEKPATKTAPLSAQERKKAYDAGYKAGSLAALSTQEREKIYNAAYDAGVKAGKKDGVVEGFDAATTSWKKFEKNAYSVRLGEQTQPLRIQIIVDGPGADSDRLAAAEVIQQHFGNWFVVEPKAPVPR